MRFNAPQSPTTTSTSSDPTGNIACQTVSLKLDEDTPGQPYLGRPDANDNNITVTEDCLFLDVYLPDSVSPSSNVPVIVWIYGGAYVAGSKGGGAPNNPLYSGTGFIDAARGMQKDVIVVVGNYRLGAYGWLAGEELIKSGTATPNAGLLDQRLLFQWVQDHISSIGGDPSQVSAWGESAGAGSILHHLVSDAPPLFNKALLQSPAFQWSWDQEDVLETTLESFSTLAECKPADIGCLQDLPLDSQNLSTANQKVFDSIFQSTKQFPFGPTVDGTLIKKLPILLLESGKSL